MAPKVQQKVARTCNVWDQEKSDPRSEGAPDQFSPHLQSGYLLSAASRLKSYFKQPLRWKSESDLLHPICRHAGRRLKAAYFINLHTLIRDARRDSLQNIAREIFRRRI